MQQLCLFTCAPANRNQFLQAVAALASNSGAALQDLGDSEGMRGDVRLRDDIGYRRRLTDSPTTLLATRVAEIRILASPKD